MNQFYENALWVLIKSQTVTINIHEIHSHSQKPPRCILSAFVSRWIYISNWKEVVFETNLKIQFPVLTDGCERTSKFFAWNQSELWNCSTLRQESQCKICRFDEILYSFSYLGKSVSTYTDITSNCFVCKIAISQNPSIQPRQIHFALLFWNLNSWI